MLDSFKARNNDIPSNEKKAASAEKPQQHSSSPPPAYSPDIIVQFSNLDLDAHADKLTKDQCIAHLKLLAAIHGLHETIACLDGIVGFKDELIDRNDADFRRIQEKWWAIYVAKAVKRFEVWWGQCVPSDSGMLKENALEDLEDKDLEKYQPQFTWTRDSLPPLDVVMVWHAYMLNPRTFFEDCLRHGKMSFWANGLPWKLIDECIDSENFDYQASSAQRQSFEQATGFTWDNLHDSTGLIVSCPACKQIMTIPWSSCTTPQDWTGPKAGIGGTGFADKDFSRICPQRSCGMTLTHDTLRVSKFRDDLRALIKDNIPMPGTILGKDGLVKTALAAKARREASFPNRLLLAMKSTMLEHTNIKTVGSFPALSMSTVRSVIESALADKGFLKQINHTRTAPLLGGEKIAVRRMMSKYWENSSIFGLDLVGAVIRQGTFIEKMHNIDWLHSPALTSTMDNLILKYTRYFEILANYPAQVAVPTLDVDLAWHTHQLNPPSYHAYSLQKTHIFIDHDDKIDEGKLSTAFEWTSKTYQKMFKELYSQCTCWYCSATRESHTSTTSRIFVHTSGQSTIDDQISALHPPSPADPGSSPGSVEKDPNNPHTNPHISAHNAIRANLPRTTYSDIKQFRKLRTYHDAHLERNYQKAVKRAQKQGHAPPPLDREAYPVAAGMYAYGGAAAAAAAASPGTSYAPYQSGACSDGDLYVGNPGCANMQTGAAGNCCQGTCGGGVAAGSCAGAGAGGCAGVAGGCAGSGGSGGGCGGGGGGGGGGCGGGGGGGC